MGVAAFFLTSFLLFFPFFYQLLHHESVLDGNAFSFDRFQTRKGISLGFGINVGEKTIPLLRNEVGPEIVFIRSGLS